MVAYWGPALFGLILAAGLVVLLFGPSVVVTIFAWWAKLDGTEQALLVLGILLSITLLAYLLQTLTVPLVRLYEGYWPEGWLKSLAIIFQRKTRNRFARLKQLKKLEDQMNELVALQQVPAERQQELTDQMNLLLSKKTLEQKRAYDACYFNFPRNIDELLKPTRLGNVLVSAEEYSYQRYCLDAVIWWPRLASLLPETFRTQVDTALTPMIAVLNLSTIVSVVALVGAVSALPIGRPWWLFLTILIAGLLLARVCYLASISQAVSYGQFLRVGFDLYRHEILKQIHISVPDNLVEERLLWDALNSVFYGYSMPWETGSIKQLPQLARPFYYDTHQKLPDQN